MKLTLFAALLPFCAALDTIKGAARKTPQLRRRGAAKEHPDDCDNAANEGALDPAPCCDGWKYVLKQDWEGAEECVSKPPGYALDYDNEGGFTWAADVTPYYLVSPNDCTCD